MVKIAPSVIAADASQLSEEVRAVCTAGADLLHMDVMDGTFVPNITFGPWITAGLAKVSSVPLDTHLMVEEPIRYVQEYIDAGSAMVTVHCEACRHLHSTLSAIRSGGAKVGVALNPGTPVSDLDAVLSSVDLILVMSVNPGFAGQAFIEESIDRVAHFAQARERRNFTYEISVDGGVGPQNADKLRAAGANILVAGSSVYKTNDYAAAIESLR